MQSDPLGLWDGPNRYAYVRGIPTRYSDRYGLFLDSWFIGGEGHGPVGGGATIGGGLTYVQCCDDKGAKKKMTFIKVCSGTSTGGSVIGGAVFGLDGKNCQSDRYSGWFLELNASFGAFGSVGVDIGFEKSQTTSWPSDLSGVWEGGLGAGKGFGASLCHYSLLNETKEDCACNK